MFRDVVVVFVEPASFDSEVSGHLVEGFPGIGVAYQVSLIVVEVNHLASLFWCRIFFVGRVSLVI